MYKHTYVYSIVKFFDIMNNTGTHINLAAYIAKLSNSYEKSN